MRVQVTPMRLNGRLLTEIDSRRNVTLGELTVESELVAELGAQVAVARLKAGGTTKPEDLLPPLVDAKVTELSDETFALTGVEVRGASRFTQAWYCTVYVGEPVTEDAEAIAD
jgi:hypothetical protein